MLKGGFFASFKAGLGFGAGGGIGWTIGQEIGRWIIRILKLTIIALVGIGGSMVARCNPIDDQSAAKATGERPPIVKKLEQRR